MQTESIQAAIKQKQFGTMRKLSSYYAEYDFCLRDIRGKDKLRILEIGIEEGGSLAAWAQYFPHVDRVVGIDIDPDCKKFERDTVRVYIGDQSDPSFLRSVHDAEGPFDVIIDDGGHTMKQQLVTFETLFPLLNEKGVFVIEDLHTSYWPRFYDAQRRTTVNFLKDRIDDLMYWAQVHPRAKPFQWIRMKIRGVMFRLGHPLPLLEAGWVTPKPRTMWQRSIRSIYIADSIAFIFKEEIERYKLERM